MARKDKGGAQLSQECPRPSTSQSEQRTVRPNVIDTAACSDWASLSR
jgi:hypothetical protein